MNKKIDLKIEYRAYLIGWLFHDLEYRIDCKPLSFRKFKKEFKNKEENK